jgi:hypothetical protein
MPNNQSLADSRPRAGFFASSAIDAGMRRRSSRSTTVGRRRGGVVRHDYTSLKRARLNAFMCRCRRCEARVTLDRRPDQYLRPRACPSCGRCTDLREDTFRIDWYRTSRKESARRGVCLCDAAPFPHRPGHGIADGSCTRKIVSLTDRNSRATPARSRRPVPAVPVAAGFLRRRA